MEYTQQNKLSLSEQYRKKLNNEGIKNKISLDGVLLQIEVTNACNHSCIFCPNRDSSRTKKMIDFNFAKKIIKECSEFLGENKKICFHMNGEPLLYKKLPDLVSYAKICGYEYAFVTTNGSLATEELLTSLFEAGLDSIKFSINAGKRETYAKIHGKDDYDKAINALRFTDNYRKNKNKNLRIFVSCVGTKQNYDELEYLKELTSPYCDEVVFYYPCGYAGQTCDKARELRCDLSKLDLNSFEITHTLPCSVLWNSINVTCEGYLSLCCSEANNRLIIEDLKEMSVKDAWFGKRMQEIRHRHLQGNIKNTPCYSCITELPYVKDDIDKELFELSLLFSKEHYV